MTVTGFIPDEETGKVLARIINDETVLSDTPGQPQIATIRNGCIYGLDGAFFGNLVSFEGSNGNNGASATVLLKKLLPK